jgi:hypothetical protein
VVVERPQRVQRRGPAAHEHRGAHVEEDLGPVERQHRRRAATPEPLGLERLDVAADLVGDLRCREHLVAEVDRRLAGVAAERGDEQVGKVDAPVQVRRLHGRHRLASGSPMTNRRFAASNALC